MERLCGKVDQLALESASSFCPGVSFPCSVGFHINICPLYFADRPAHHKHAVLSSLQSEEATKTDAFTLSVLLFSSCFFSFFHLLCSSQAPLLSLTLSLSPPPLSRRARRVPYRANEGCMLWRLVASTQIEVPSAVTNLFGFCPPHSN